MLTESSAVVRRRITFFPISNTEVNVARLPPAKDLAGMELQYRRTLTDLAGAAGRASWWIAVFVILGSLYSWSLLFAPVWAPSAWQVTGGEDDGARIVWMMLLSMLGVCVALTVCFIVPKPVRLMTFTLTFTGLIISVCSQVWGPWTARLCSLIFAATLLLLWHKSFIRFVEEWLQADPRDRGKKRKRHSRASLPRSLPNFSAGLKVVHEFFIHQNHSGAAGVFPPSLSCDSRLILTALMSGAIFDAVGTVLLGSQGNFGRVLLATILTVSAFVIAAGVVLSQVTAMLKDFEREVSGDNRTWWEQNVDRLRNSKHVATDPIGGGRIREAAHFFLGVEPWKKFPVFLHQLILAHHIYIAGRTGSGKTSIGLLQFLIQVIRGYRISASGPGSVDDEKNWSEKAPVVIMDLKGDPVLFQTAKFEAEQRGQVFRFLALRRN